MRAAEGVHRAVHAVLDRELVFEGITVQCLTRHAVLQLHVASVRAGVDGVPREDRADQRREAARGADLVAPRRARRRALPKRTKRLALVAARALGPEGARDYRRRQILHLIPI